MNRNKNALKSLLLILTFVVSIFAGASDAMAKGNAYAKGQDRTDIVQFVAINDFHGNVLESSSNPGIAKVAGAIDKLSRKYPTFFLSAGDNFQGTAISNLTHGEVVNEAFQLMNLKASAIGNHEYDWGKNMMDDWSKEGNYPFLASNIVFKGTDVSVKYAKPYIIQKVTLPTKQVVKIGIIGIATPETATKTLLANVADIEFTDPVAATNKWAKVLWKEKKVDAVIALTHLGGFIDKDSKELTGELDTYVDGIEGVSVVFSGHTHQTIDVVENGVQVLQGYYNGRSLQVAQLGFNRKTGDLTSVDGYVDNIAKYKDSMLPNRKVAKLVQTYQKELAPILNEVIGYNKQPLSHDTTLGLTPLGQWTAKALTEIGKTQVAIVNGGGIREPMPAGDITMGTMYSIFPFDNTLVTLDVKGDHLKRLIEHGIGSGALTTGGFRDGQFYGVEIEVNMSLPYGKRIVSMTVGGEPFNPEATYSVATLDFLVTGGDKYPFTGATNIVDTFLPVRELLIDYIRINKTINHTFDANAYVLIN